MLAIPHARFSNVFVSGVQAEPAGADRLGSASAAGEEGDRVGSYGYALFAIGHFEPEQRHCADAVAYSSLKRVLCSSLRGARFPPAPGRLHIGRPFAGLQQGAADVLPEY